MSKSVSKKDNRITARLPQKSRKTIEHAAEISGSTMNQFIVQAALEKAEKIVEKARTLSFSKEEADKILDMLVSQKKPNKALSKAIKDHSELVN